MPGTAATAHVATPSCGPICADIFSQEFGDHRSPDFLLDLFQQHARIGQPIILYRSGTNDPAEDFRLEFQGTVADFLATRLPADRQLHQHRRRPDLGRGQALVTQDATGSRRAHRAGADSPAGRA